MLEKTPLTSGEWSVSEDRVWSDEEHGLVYFSGYRDTPLERHLYVASLTRPGDVRRITDLGYSHTSIEMSEVGLQSFFAL